MSQADNRTTLIRSRRAVLAGIASAAALPIQKAQPATAVVSCKAAEAVTGYQRVRDIDETSRIS